jgi:hypothetical protein
MHRALVLVLLAAAACSEGSKDTPSSTATTKETAKPTAKATATATAAPGPKKIGKLPVTLDLPATAIVDESASGNAMIVDGEVKFTVAALEGDIAKEKKDLQNLPLFNFKKWVKEEKDLAVGEFDGPDYRAIFVVEVAGKKYVCKNVGTPAGPSAEQAEATVKRCQGLKPG